MDRNRLSFITFMFLIMGVLIPLNAAAAAENKAASTDWTERWKVDIESIIGTQEKNPIFPQLGPDGTVYIMNQPEDGMVDRNIIAISADGKVKWTYRTPGQYFAFFHRRPFDTDALGNVYVYYGDAPGSGVELKKNCYPCGYTAVHKIGPDGNLQASYNLPSPAEPQVIATISHLADGMAKAVMYGLSGTVYLYQLSAEGEVLWQKELHEGYKPGRMEAGFDGQERPSGDGYLDLELIGDYTVVRQEYYYDVYDANGDKSFRFEKPSKERFQWELTKDNKFIGVGSTYELQGTPDVDLQDVLTAVRNIGLDTDGTVLWTREETVRSALYKLRDHFIYSAADGPHDWDTRLVAIDPLTGLETAVFQAQAGKRLTIRNNTNFNWHREYRNDPYLDVWESQHGAKNTFYLLDPVSLKQAVEPLTDLSTKTGVSSSLSPVYYQQGGQMYEILWNRSEARRFDWTGQTAARAGQ